MKKILITRKLIKESEDKATKNFEPIFNTKAKGNVWCEANSLIKEQVYPPY